MLDQQTLQATIGIAGTVSDDVLKISVPRNDLRVTIDGFEIIPFMGLTSWVAFRKDAQQTTVMGDIVLLERSWCSRVFGHREETLRHSTA
jgi:hypothetical protein